MNDLSWSLQRVNTDRLWAHHVGRHRLTVWRLGIGWLYTSSRHRWRSKERRLSAGSLSINRVHKSRLSSNRVHNSRWHQCCLQTRWQCLSSNSTSRHRWLRRLSVRQQCSSSWDWWWLTEWRLSVHRMRNWRLTVHWRCRQLMHKTCNSSWVYTQYWLTVAAGVGWVCRLSCSSSSRHHCGWWWLSRLSASVLTSCCCSGAGYAMTTSKAQQV